MLRFARESESHFASLFFHSLYNLTHNLAFDYRHALLIFDSVLYYSYCKLLKGTRVPEMVSTIPMGANNIIARTPICVIMEISPQGFLLSMGNRIRACHHKLDWGW